MRIRGPARSAIAALAAAALAAAVLVGCGGSSESSEGTAGGASPFDWPMLGRVPERTYRLPADSGAVDPPLRQAWSTDTHGAIEFPPAIANGVAYLVNRYGNAHAIRLRDGKVLWKRTPNPDEAYPRVDATEPVYANGMLFFAYQVGDLLAIDAVSGEEVWREEYSHLEFTPLVADETVYFGAEETELIASDASDGATRWQFRTSGPATGGLSYHRGRLYVPVHEGTLICLDAESGKVLWRTDTTRVSPRPGGEVDFHSPVAVAFGHVYATRNDHRVFALDQRNGRVAWSRQAGDFLASSPAVARVPGTPPTVYIGSSDERLYALHALTGKQEWRYDLGRPVTGTPSVIGRTVYVPGGPPLGVVGIDVRSHEPVFEQRDAVFAPVSDGRGLYLVKGTELIGLLPRQ